MQGKNGIHSQGLWCLDDVKKRCSKKDARNILVQIGQRFDAAYGITWRMIEDNVEDNFREKKSEGNLYIFKLLEF